MTTMKRKGDAYRRATQRNLKSDLKHYSLMLEASIRECGFLFRQRGPFDGVATWGYSDVRRYDYCRTGFYQAKANVKFYRRRIAETVTRLIAIQSL